ncbi:hypothetical protein PFISCL1PPCAC_16461 [Pristionchus fissidentatus]|uniref:Uncharacterized protein n=1 Tax=Pristionchus fissidentatus TaxID=1538716 RepID=A0AAV5W5N1_9BILA|nr:hypothetical protein PFISCL1PPCAC_16461 [Pristionchus fissidentatus]
MRFLTVLFFCASSALLFAEEEPHTTVETIYETVTRTIVREVTDPIQSDAATVVIVESSTVPATTTVAPITVVYGTAEPGGVMVAGSNITEITGPLRMCSCDEASVCRKESANELNTCFESCNANTKDFGDNTESYLECFTKNNATIIEAEECVSSGMKNYCTVENDTKFIKNNDWKALTGFDYASDAKKEIKDNYLWKTYEPKYAKLQNFFYCTRHCIHNKMNQCTKAKGCGVRMPNHEEFVSTMRSCTKKNNKIAQATMATCQCLAWQKGVTDLRGSCVYMGNNYYVDKA